MELLLAAIGGGLLGTILSIFAGRTKNSAEIQKLFAEAEQIRISSQSGLQNQIDELRDRNTELFDDVILRRAELDRMHGELANMQSSLSSEIARNVMLAEEVRNLKLALVEKDAALHNLGLQIESYQLGIKEEVKKQTGKLKLQS